MIYRLIHRSEDTLKRCNFVANSGLRIPIKPDDRPMLSGQFLRTCRQIYNETLPILYGENTWQLLISNIPAHPAVSVPVITWQPLQEWPSSGHILQYVRHFEIAVLFEFFRPWDYNPPLAPRFRSIRRAVQDAVEALQHCQTDYLRLKIMLNPMSGNCPIFPLYTPEGYHIFAGVRDELDGLLSVLARATSRCEKD